MSNDPQIFGDQFISGKFDTADFSGFESKSTQFAAALFTHVLTEYTVSSASGGQTDTSNFAVAHDAGLRAEGQVMGAASRVNLGSSSPTPGATIGFGNLNSDGIMTESFQLSLDPITGTPD